MPTARLLTVGTLAAGLMLGMAPAAGAGPPPNPDPGVPAPAVPVESGSAGCQAGEQMQDGNCVPAMTAVASTAGGGADETVPLRLSDTESSTITTGIGADLVPNLNGTPCTGYWASMACVGQQDADIPSVQPRSTLSSSP